MEERTEIVHRVLDGQGSTKLLAKSSILENVIEN